MKSQHNRIEHVAIPAIQSQCVLPSTGARNKTPARCLLDEIVIFKALNENHNEVSKETDPRAEEEEEAVDVIDLLDYSSCSSSDLGDDDVHESSESEESAPSGATALPSHTG